MRFLFILCFVIQGLVACNSDGNDNSAQPSAARAAGPFISLWCGASHVGFNTGAIPRDVASIEEVTFTSFQDTNNGLSDFNMVAPRTTDAARMPTSAVWKHGIVFALPDSHDIGGTTVRTVIFQPGVFQGIFAGNGKALDARYITKLNDEKAKSLSMECKEEAQ